MFLNNPKKRQNFIMWALFSLLLFVILLIQTVFFGQFTIANTHLNLLPLLVSAVAVTTNADAGGIFGLSTGVVWALTGGSDAGMSMVCFTLSGVLSGYLCDAILTRHLFSAVLTALLSLSVTAFGIYAVRTYMEGSTLWGLQLTLRQILLTLPLSPLLYWCCKTIRKAGPQNG